VPVLYTSAAFLGAFLLFCVQPMIARMALPRFGGAPAVWTTCMLFFQLALLTGYSFVHVTSRWLDARRQALLHLVLLATPIVFLPIGLPSREVGTDRSPVAQLLGELLATVGLPFFIVATTAPMLQRWLAATANRRAHDPYPLYAASNAGSLSALILYVSLIEPVFALGAQSRLWTVGYGGLVVLLLGCAVGLWRSPPPASLPENQSESRERIGPFERLRWVALAFAPSSLLLGVTTFLTTDLAPVPLLWVVPLTLYLLSFIIAFANPPAWVSRACGLTLPVAIVLTLGLMVTRQSVPFVETSLVHLATFSLAAIGCHTELARRRPSASQLTDFYLMISLGGALGGVFNAILAPRLFSWVAEYPLVLALSAWLVPFGGSRRLDQVPSRARARWLDAALPLLLGGAAFGASQLRSGGTSELIRFAPLGVCLLFVRRSARFALGLAIVSCVIAQGQDAHQNVVLKERSFFGMLRVSVNYPVGMNTLAHGRTIHGMQRRSPEVSTRRVPLTYYFPTGPIGQVFSDYQGTGVVQHVGVIGLGVGSLAGYGRTGQQFTFFEIDPAVERIARNPAYFHFLDDCRAHWRVVLGDARLTISHEPDGSFGLIVLDAFNGDAIPVHLLTREALATYLAKLEERGLIALHISNSYVDLEPVVASLVRDSGLVGLDLNERLEQIPPGELQQGRMLSHWVVLARREADLSRLTARPGWRPLTDRGRVAVWTDDHSNLVHLLRWH
jgi:hypothetical protein